MSSWLWSAPQWLINEVHNTIGLIIASMSSLSEWNCPERLDEWGYNLFDQN